MPDRRSRRTGDRRRGAADSAAPGHQLPTGAVAIQTGTVEVRRDRADPSSVTVLVNGVPSSHLDLGDPARLEFEYMQQMSALIDGLLPGPLDAVHLGAAACTLPRWLEAERPGSRQLAVDLDPVLLRLVREWFDLPRSPRLRLRAQDARAAVEGLADASVDLIVRDVFAPDVTPAHLTTTEFLAEVRRVLRPGGLYLANCADRPPLALARAEIATARAVFDDVALTAEPAQLKGRRYGNLVLAATRRPLTGDGPDEHGLDEHGLDDPRLVRRLRTLPVPVHLLHGDDLDAFAGSAAVRRDRPGARPADVEAACAQKTAPTSDGLLRGGGRSRPADPWAPG